LQASVTSVPPFRNNSAAAVIFSLLNIASIPQTRLKAICNIEMRFQQNEGRLNNALRMDFE